MRLLRSLVLVACGLPLTGCGSREAGSPAAGPAGSPAAPAGIDAASGLDLDGNRVRSFSPDRWKRAPKSYDYLVRYQSTPQLPYPSVVVVAADPPEGFAEVTPANHRDFVAAVAARLAEEFGGEGGPALIRKPAATTSGPHHAVSWSAPGEAKLDGAPKPIERDCTAVVIDGRMYTVETWGLRGKLDDKARAAGRAVAAALVVPSLDPVESLVPPAPKPAEPASEPAAAQ